VPYFASLTALVAALRLSSPSAKFIASDLLRLSKSLWRAPHAAGSAPAARHTGAASAGMELLTSAALTSRVPPHRAARVFSFIRLGICRRSYVLSGRRPKPDVGNLLRTGACAFTVAGWTCAHATRPPCSGDRAFVEGFPRPAPRLSRGVRRHCSLRAG
jgi:hypothetical protein